MARRPAWAADPQRVAEAAQSWPTEYLECRNGNHVYKPRTVTWFSAPENYYEVIQRCIRCKQAERVWILDRNAFILSSSTRYLVPVAGSGKPNYVIKGLGRPDQAGRAAIRLELVTRWNPVTRNLNEE